MCSPHGGKGPQVNWFYNTSIFITVPVFVGGFVIISCAVVLGLRPVVQRRVDDPKEWDHALGHVIETFGVIFGILLALVAVSVYENFGEAREASLKRRMRPHRSISQLALSSA